MIPKNHPESESIHSYMASPSWRGGSTSPSYKLCNPSPSKRMPLGNG